MSLSIHVYKRISTHAHYKNTKFAEIICWSNVQQLNDFLDLNVDSCSSNKVLWQPDNTMILPGLWYSLFPCDATLHHEQQNCVVQICTPHGRTGLILEKSCCYQAPREDADVCSCFAHKGMQRSPSGLHNIPDFLFKSISWLCRQNIRQNTGAHRIDSKPFAYRMRKSCFALDYGECGPNNLNSILPFKLKSCEKCLMGTINSVFSQLLSPSDKSEFSQTLAHCSLTTTAFILSKFSISHGNLQLWQGSLKQLPFA